MISHLSGKLLAQRERLLIIDVHGVGYRVFSTPETIQAVSQMSDVSLWTHLAVRENALDLYGFATEEELHFFELLLTISGIGPKSALSILSGAGVETLKNAVASGNAAHLTKISGIGRKNAEKIVLELHGKLNAPSESDTANMQTESDSIAALQSLGYSQKEAREAIKKVPKEITSTAEIVKFALKTLS